MFDNKSDYALNKKNQDSIVYCDSTGHITHITSADFSSEEEFLFWKSWSDADYKETDYADSYFHRHIQWQPSENAMADIKLLCIPAST